MDTTWFAVTILLCSTTWLSECQNDCVYEECVCVDTLILCNAKHLQTIPPLVTTNLTGQQSLQLNDNQIQYVPAGSLPPNLAEIDFENNPIASIDDTAFDNSTTTLQTLYFSNTQFTRIPNAFGHLRSLVYLSMFTGNITDWNDEAMKKLGPTLQTLHLIDIGLTAWPSWIQNFSSLRDLALTGGIISSIPDNAFDAMTNNLTSLNLRNNSFTVIPKALTKLTKLQTLNIQENKIYDLTFFPQACPLFSVSLNNNSISDAVMLSNVLRSSANTLMFLEINYNRLTAIPDFSFLTKVYTLDLTYNKISDPISGEGPALLNELDLSYNFLQAPPRILTKLLSVTGVELAYNQINTIYATDFHNMTYSLDLSYNVLTEITDSSFPINSSIMYLQLNNNPITYISDVALRNMPNMRQLNLRATKITRLPLGLSIMTAVYQLDVSDCPNLVCTCMESSLTDWFQGLNPDSVIGQCGITSVSTFFSTLSRLCPT